MIKVACPKHPGYTGQRYPVGRNGRAPCDGCVTLYGMARELVRDYRLRVTCDVGNTPKPKQMFGRPQPTPYEAQRELCAKR
jgi:hypothetical protein